MLYMYVVRPCTLGHVYSFFSFLCTCACTVCNNLLSLSLHSFQANLNRLEQVEVENTELAALVEEEKRQCQQLTSKIEKQEREVGHYITTYCPTYIISTHS